MKNIENVKRDLIEQIDMRLNDKIIEPSNAELLKKLISNAETINEAIMIGELGTTYKRTGFHFDKRLEKMGAEIKYLKRNDDLSFSEDSTSVKNKLIIGDNYDALLNLLVSYRGLIDIIYIDPPYSKDSMGRFAETNYTNSLTRDNLLSMLYPRLLLARELLSTFGVIYCSIDDKNQAYLKCLFDDIFGEQNFIGLITQNKGNAQNDAINMQKNSDYILTYCKNRKYINDSGKRKEVPLLQEGTIIKKEVFKDENGKYYYKGSGLVTGSSPTLKDRPNLGWSIYYNPTTKDKIGICDYDLELAKTSDNENEVYTTKLEYIEKGYIVIRPPRKKTQLGRWTWKLEKFNREKNKILISDDNSVHQKIFVDINETKLIDGKRYYIKDTLTKNTKSIWDFSSAKGTTQLTEIIPTANFDNPKNVFMIKKLIQIYQEKENPIILDFFAGSGTTGQAVLDLNNETEKNYQFILCTNNEITDKTPNGIAYDVTTKRLKRIMSGKCYDGTTDFLWLDSNDAYGGNLEVYEIETINSSIQDAERNPFNLIDETCYGKEHFETIKEKISWVCNNFEHTQKYIEEET